MMYKSSDYTVVIRAKSRHLHIGSLFYRLFRNVETQMWLHSVDSFISVYSWIYGLVYLQTTSDINAIFYNEFFTILILADVLILLLSFQYTERYNQLIRNTGFVICTILIRLSFGVSGLTNVLLIISSVAFGLMILTIYNMEENPIERKTDTN